MPARQNMVNLPPSGVVIALMYWAGDLPEAMRLARLIQELEPRRRDDVIFALCPRFDVERTSEQEAVFMALAGKFPTMFCPSRTQVTGHPDGAAAMWSDTMAQLSEAWHLGRVNAHSVFTIEADGCPLRADWLDVVLAEHRRTLDAGKRVTGALTNHGLTHLNGSSLIMHCSAWMDHPSLHRTPTGQAYDLFHAATLMAEARPTPWIKNVYGEGKWSPESLAVMAKETAWACNLKGTSVIDWAERTLTKGAPNA
jgi:hypothetical protein